MAPRINSALILTVTLACLASLTHFGHFTKGNAFDFYQFWMFGLASKQSSSVNIYSEQQRSAIGAKFYQQAQSRPGSSPRYLQVAELRKEPQAISTPLLYSCFGLISGGRFEADFLDYQLLATLCAIASVLLLCRAMQYTWTTACLWLVCLFMWFGSFFSEVQVGNVNRIQLLIIAIFLWLQNRENHWARDLFGGVMLSLMITFKPNTALVPLLLSIAWLIDGQFARLGRTAIGVFLGTAAAIALSAWHFGSAQCWIDWLTAINQARQNMQIHEEGNFSLSWFISNQFNIDAALPMTGALMACVIVAIMFGRSKQPSTQRDLAVLACGIALALLAAPLTWHHYFLLASPLWIMLFEPNARFPRSMSAMGIIILLAAALSHVVNDFIRGPSTFGLTRAVMWLSVILPLSAALLIIAKPSSAKVEKP
jgi:hypothetical protein